MACLFFVSDMIPDNLAIDAAGQLWVASKVFSNKLTFLMLNTSQRCPTPAGFREALGEPFISFAFNGIQIINKHRSKFFLWREIPSSKGCYTFMRVEEYLNADRITRRFSKMTVALCRV